MRTTIVLIAAFLLAGCAGPAHREPAPSANHPANSDAAQAPAPTEPSKTLGNTEDVAGEAAAVAYTCPDHPRVLEADPGNCPYCGQPLVPSKSRQTTPVRAAPTPAKPTDTPAPAQEGHEGHEKHEEHKP
jgi:hypothetical protein